MISAEDQKKFLSQAEWVRLPQTQRTKLREVFNVPKSGHAKVTTMFGGHDILTSDGSEPEDLLKALHIQHILAFLGKSYDPKHPYHYGQEFQAVLAKVFPTEYNQSQTNVLPPKVSTAHGLADFPKEDLPKVIVESKPKRAKKAK